MHATARVRSHIPDISPDIALRRDRVYTTFPSTRRHVAQPPMGVIEEIDTSYAWKKLPNISAYKSAIVRNKVCEGLMYLLPSNKNSSSLARPYTADLGAMFEEPYHRFKPSEYNEENVKSSSAIHFSPNTHRTRLISYEQVKRDPNKLNSQSKLSYNKYSSLVLEQDDKSKERGRKGNLPVALKLGPAELELQKEVTKILDDVGIQSKVDEEQNIANMEKTSTGQRSLKFKDQGSVASQASSPRSHRKSAGTFHQHTYSKKSAGYRDFRELREAEVPRPKLPETLKTRFLTDEKTQEIWNWLHWDFKKSKFEHFIEVCS